jgi:hypothetical protein
MRAAGLPEREMAAFAERIFQRAYRLPSGGFINIDTRACGGCTGESDHSGRQALFGCREGLCRRCVASIRGYWTIVTRRWAITAPIC